MKPCRYLLATAMPVAVAVACAGPALAAATKVNVRVEGTSRTLLATRTVTAPTLGSITKGGTPSGVCPATSAAGALTAATHGDWNGTYSSGLGVEVTRILGTSALYGQGSYWEFFVNDRAASEGVCDTTLKPGDQLLFAQVPAKGRSELPIVVTAPTTVKAGDAFTLKSFVYPGKGSATKPVKVTPLVTDTKRASSGGPSTVAVSHEVAGSTRLTLRRLGTYTISATAKGDIRSAAVTVTVVR